MSRVVSNISIRTASLNDIKTIQTVVAPAWRAVYGPILSSEQVEYMLELFYSDEELNMLIGQGKQEFILLFEEKEMKGFAAFSVREEDASIHKLNKLYLLPECKGKGFGRLLIEEVQRRVLLQGVSVLELNVNKYNDSHNFYRKMGFEVAYEVDLPVGPYFMNDFVMRKRLRNKEYLYSTKKNRNINCFGVLILCG